MKIHLSSSTGFLPLLLGLFLLLGGVRGAYAQISGTVFRDIDADGAYVPIPAPLTSYTYGEPGVGGITVTAYNSSGGAVSTTTSTTAGTYTLSTGIAANTAYRIEFTGLAAGDFTGPVGANNNSSIQFVTTGASGITGINFGINYPTDYCQANPSIATACYVFGDQQLGLNATDPVFITFPYNAGSRAILTNEGTTTVSGIAGTPYPGAYDLPTSHSIAVPARTVGTTFGIAYARRTKQYYASAFFKKHAGFGPGGPGAVYVINATTGALTSTFTVPNATINSHNTLDYRLDNSNTGWDGVGKTSLGGMDLSDDEQTLYVMNLENRNLYALNATTGAVLANQPMTAVTGCPVGDVRPFAVEYRKGTLYVGIICSAESTPTNRAALQAYVYTVNPTTLALASTPVFQFPLNYPRGKAASTGPALWLPWRTTYGNISTQANTPATATRIVYPMPMLTNLDFDVNNDLIIGLRDRLGDIAGHNLPDNPNDILLVTQGRIAGDVLRASATGTNAWTLESNGRVGGRGTSRQSTNQGPGGAEFYQGDSYPISSSVTGTNPVTITTNTPNYSYTITTGTSTVGPGQISTSANGIQGFGENHDEVSLGTLLQLPGQGEVLALVFDPVPDNNDDGFFDGGVRRMSNVTGSWTQSYRIYAGETSSTDNFGKAAGLSEPVAQCNPAPIEIGNRVWNDTDKDGTQDAGETSLTGLPGLTVQLLSGGTVIATTTVSATGTYLFSSNSVTALQPNTSYQVRLVLPTNAQAISTSLAGARTTVDSDANPAGVISLTTGNYGENNHTYDIGVVTCTTAATLTSSTVCNGTSATLTATGGTNYVFSNGTSNTTGILLVSPATTTTYSVTVSSITDNCTAIATGTVTVNPAVTATATASPGTICAGTSATLTATGGTQYRWNTGATMAAVAVAPTSTTAYSVTVTNSTGCSAITSATVTVSPAVTAVITANPSAVICNGTSATLTASGGTVFRWNTGATTAAISVAPTSTTAYSVTVTNASGCSGITSTTVTVNPSVTATLSSATICNGTTATLTANASGGSGFTYNWAPAGTGNTQTVTVSPTATTTYTVTVTNSNGCSALTTATVTVNPAVTATVAVSPSSTICQGTSATITATGGSFYRFSDGTTVTNNTSGQLVVTPATVGSNPYAVTVTSGQSCSATAPVVITVNALPQPTILGTATVCAGGPISLTATPTTGLTYAWTGPGGSLGSSNPLVIPNSTTANSGTYQVRVTDINGCTATASSVITVNPAIVATVNTATLTCQNPTATLTVSSSQLNLSYQWRGPGRFTATTQSVTVSAVGTYTVVTTSTQSGCSSTATTTVMQDVTLPVATVNSATLTCQNNYAAVTLTVISPPANTTYQWTGPAGFAANTASISTTIPGIYTVVATNPKTGCSTTLTTTVTQDAGVQATLTQSSCVNNGTNAVASDDYFTVTIQATNTGNMGTYEVVLGAASNGTGGTVLNPGGTAFGSSVTVGGVGQGNAKGFLANGSSTYPILIRQVGQTNCHTFRLTGTVAPCSTCFPIPCQPGTLQKQ